MVRDHLPRLRQELALDAVLANVENASGGLGISAKSAAELHLAGVDIMTSGNHVWKFADIRPMLNTEPWLLRPANYPAPAPGRGAGLFDFSGGMVLMVINLQGRTFMDPIDCPFAAAERLVREAPDHATIVVDFHAEATSEKRALAHMLREKVQVVVGTHTHVQTNDACILDRVTGFMTDLGMCGPVDSCLGMDSEIIVRKFRTGQPQRFELAKGPCVLNGALIELEEGRCRGISAWTYAVSNEQEES